jgi:hypothetical protein
LPRHKRIQRQNKEEEVELEILEVEGKKIVDVGRLEIGQTVGTLRLLTLGL